MNLPNSDSNKIYFYSFMYLIDISGGKSTIKSGLSTIYDICFETEEYFYGIDQNDSSRVRAFLKKEEQLMDASWHSFWTTKEISEKQFNNEFAIPRLKNKLNKEYNSLQSFKKLQKTQEVRYLKIIEDLQQEIVNRGGDYRPD